MLKSLHIENIATIKQLNIDFSEGFTVLTGETGAGKSVIIDSINLLLGAAKSRELLRSGEEYALVEAYFSDIDEDTEKELDSFGFTLCDDDRTVYTSRRISSDGKSVSKLNGRTVPASVQKQILRGLINIHGQHDNQILLQPSSHLGFIDKYADLSEIFIKYSGIYEEYVGIKKRIKELSTDGQEKIRMSDMLKYQISEINEAKLREGEEEILLSKKKKIQNAEKIIRSSKIAYRALYHNEKGASAFDLIGMACEAIDQLAGDIEEVRGYSERLNEYRYEIEDIAERVHDLAGIGEGNPTAMLDKIETRLDTVQKLKRKYGESVSDVLAFAADAEEKLKNIESSDELLKDAENELAETEKKLYSAAKELHDRRKKASEELCSKVLSELKFLEMEKIRFCVSLGSEIGEGGIPEYTETGYDKAEFMIATNIGEEEKPLSRIASGGELSRIMLALKSVLSSRCGYETQIFDEVDTGVSGKTAQKIGMKLHDISRSSQVLCVTHLAQIAALADTHFFIKKTEKDGRAQTSLSELSGEERVGEVARILGGINITKTQMDAAREMIEQKNEL